MADPFRFACDSLDESALRVLAFSCEEELGRPYTVRVFVDSRTELDVESALGKPGSLSVGPGGGQGKDTVFHGLLFEAELLLAVGTRRIHRLTLAPELGTLGLSLHSRVFVDKSVPEVIEAILKESQVTAPELRLSGKYPARRHICQYKESDLEFVHRWMEREGIYYYFLQEENGAKLILCDDRSHHDDAPSAQVRYYPSDRDDVISGECLTSWRRAHAAVVEGLELGDYDYLKPALRISASRAGAAIGFEERVRFEDNLQDQQEAERLTAVRAEGLSANQVRYHGRGRVRGLHAGLRFTLEEHPREALNQRYQLCRVTHRGSQLQSDPDLARTLGIPPGDGYHVEIEALTSSVQYRPERRAAWPTAYGVESAVVESAAKSPYADLDPEGRYRVRMLFDEAKTSEGSASAWVRMLQPHGGSPEGHHFPLRAGTEVLMAFVHGDPDRPYIVGAVPTPTTPSTVTGTNNTRNVIQTGSLNRLEIEDREGGQYLDLSSPPESTFVHLGAHAGLGDHNIVVSTTGDGLHHAGGKRDLTVGGAQTEDVTGNLVEEYSANQTTHVTGAFTETIKAGATQTIKAGATQTIDAGLTQTILGGETRTVNGALTETITGGRTQDIVGATTETIGSALTQTVSGFVGISTPAAFVLNASASITMMTPGAGTLSGLGGVRLFAPAGQMTVDAWYKSFGDQHLVAYGIKLSVGAVRFSWTGSWTRYQLTHICAYGVKIETKIITSKQWAEKEEKFGALDVKVAGLLFKKSGVAQID